MATVPSAPRNERSQLVEVIRRLGGPTVVGQHFGLKAGPICMWTLRGQVPPAHRLEFWRLCAARDIAWHPPGFENLRLVEASPKIKQCGETVATSFATVNEEQPAEPAAA